MKRKLLYLVILFISCRADFAQAQQSFIAEDGVAVFYPAGFDSSATLPSFAISTALLPVGEIPFGWKISPVFSSDSGKSIVTIHFGEADLYGNGEVTGPLRRNGTKVSLWNTDNFIYSKDEGRRLYQAHPWLMGVRKDGSSFGIIADHTWKQEFDCSNPIVIKSDGPAFRVIVIEKESPAALIQTLAKLTGKMELPPLWALGYHQCRYSYYPDARVLQIAKEFRKRKLPADVMWMDIDYMQKYKVFTFDSVMFPNPTALNRQLHALDFKSVYMIDPGVKKEDGYFVYDQGSRGDHWVKDKNGKVYTGKVWPGECVFPDFTRPSTQKWWGRLYKKFMHTGVDGVWNDMNEPSVFNEPGGTMPEDNQHEGGGELTSGTHLRYHNVYGQLMVKASRDGIQLANPDKRPFILSRANFLGGQRTAATWTGDNSSTWEHFKMATPMILNLGLSGQPFSGPDLGGFAGSPDSNLFVNWMSVGVFYPFCRNHTSKSSKDQEPWMYGKRVEDEARIALNRRYRLLPYLYTLFWEASQTGMPVMRPVFFADHKDTSLRKEEYAFMLGSDLIIVPKWAKKVKLPKGVWKPILLETEEPDSLSVQPILLMRGGSILPLSADIIQSTACYNSDSLTLILCFDSKGKALGRVYSDAGEGLSYKKGDFNVREFTAELKSDGTCFVQCIQSGGKQMKKQQWYRIAIATNTRIQYSDWHQGDKLNFNLNK